jgi:hypothetical protein
MVLPCRSREAAWPDRGRSQTSQRRIAIADTEPPYASRALEHVRHLAETIGPRGSTSPQEREAAEYARGVLEGMGLSPRVQPFTSAVSAWRPYALAVALTLLAVATYPIGGRVTAVVAAALVGAVLMSALLEMDFTPNPLRWLLPKGHSQNVVAVVPPGGEVRRRAVLVGHLDTHRTPFLFASPSRLRIFGLLSPLTFGSMAVLVALFLAGAVWQEAALYYASLAPTVLLLLVLPLLMQADFTPYTAGANDNASGAAVVLSLAERLKETPLANTEVWTVNTGCEEVGCYGADAFLREHRERLDGACFIAIDSVGGPGSGPCYITREGMTKRYHSDPGLIAMAQEIAARRLDLGAYPKVMSIAYTEGAVGVKHGLPSITFVNLRPDGVLPHWHRPDDTVENIDPDVLARSEEFVWELLQRIDAA